MISGMIVKPNYNRVHVTIKNGGRRSGSKTITVYETNADEFAAWLTNAVQTRSGVKRKSKAAKAVT